MFALVSKLKDKTTLRGPFNTLAQAQDAVSEARDLNISAQVAIKDQNIDIKFCYDRFKNHVLSNLYTSEFFIYMTNVMSGQVQGRELSEYLSKNGEKVYEDEKNEIFKIN